MEKSTADTQELPIFKPDTDAMKNPYWDGKVHRAVRFGDRTVAGTIAARADTEKYTFQLRSCQVSCTMESVSPRYVESQE